MSDTPETDAFAIKFKTTCGGRCWVPVDIARKLERERDEAIRQRNETNESSVFSCNFYYEEKLKAERERDQLKQLLAADSERVDAYLGVCIERDEARDKYDQICSQTLIEINKVCDERDKLREALRDVLKVSEPTPVMTYQKMEDIASKALKDTAK